MSDCNLTDGECENCSYMERELEAKEKRCCVYRAEINELKNALKIIATDRPLGCNPMYIAQKALGMLPINKTA